MSMPPRGFGSCRVMWKVWEGNVHAEVLHVHTIQLVKVGMIGQVHIEVPLQVLCRMHPIITMSL